MDVEAKQIKGRQAQSKLGTKECMDPLPHACRCSRPVVFTTILPVPSDHNAACMQSNRSMQGRQRQQRDAPSIRIQGRKRHACNTVQYHPSNHFPFQLKFPCRSLPPPCGNPLHFNLCFLSVALKSLGTQKLYTSSHRMFETYIEH